MVMITDKSALKDAFRNETGKNASFKNGKVRKAFLSWNLRQLKANATNVYYPGDRLYNPVSKRLIKPKYDKRWRGACRRCPGV